MKVTVPHARSRVRDKMSFNTTIMNVASGPVANSANVTGYTAPTGTLETMNDIVDPDFKKKSAEGKVVMNPMTATRYVCTSHGGQGPQLVQIAPAYAAGQLYSWDGDRLSAKLANNPTSSKTPRINPLVVSGIDFQRVIEVASTRSAQRSSDAQILVTFAELHKTARLLPDLITNSAKFLNRFNYAYSKNVSKGYSQRNALDQLAAMRDLWLATRFGVRPLLYDLIGTIKALEHKRTNMRVRWTQRGTSEDSVSDVRTSSIAEDGITAPLTIASHASYKVRAMSIWEGHLDLMDDLGLSVTSIPLAVLDLTYMSFVLNWFVNVNEYVNAMGQALNPNWNVLAGCYVATHETSSSWQVTGDSVNTNATASSYNLTRHYAGVVSVSKSVKTRVIGIPKASLSVRPQPLAFTRDLRLLDAAALLGKVMGGPGIRLLRKTDISF